MRGRTGGIAIMYDPVNTSPVNMFIQAFAAYLGIDITIGTGPVTFLDDAMVHIDNVQAAIRARGCINGPEVHIRGSQEFSFIIGIGEEGLTAAIAHFSPADQSADRFAYKKIAFHGLRETVAPENGLTAGGGEMVKGAVLPEAFLPSLYIGGTDDRPYLIAS